MMNFDVPYNDILDFWFDGLDQGDWPPGECERRWFSGGAAVDARIREQFSTRLQAALDRELVAWERHPRSRLALILLLDQFSRNIHRGEAAAFAGDHQAVTLTLEGISTGMESGLPWAGQVFFYMPLMHAEDLALQNQGIACFRSLLERVPEHLKSKIENNLKFAEEHRDIIARFGRFPHRNEALGRESTTEEAVFLENAKRYGQ
ncbi:DUF924 family protein [Alloalcanivorax xenomutans]|jgi:uncharacterized protein (DUF924 family)|uniref:DUF924 family protein n=1 Tax=Alloalcanivorax xenomutans TaxID=1094342 RepID=UPI0006D5BB32|nr:DUF924 family protein [Alloalcanivorax xenomutans]ARB45902.1 hypothetical protein P40_11185 [Alloalcanivorax xenomutans]WOD26485.1 DUF924 family protein [Alloalcanivorax xenomutans]CUR47225.1 FIG027190: Putative transmembrane protein [Alloalcanivorax xenomutans]